MTKAIHSSDGESPSKASSRTAYAPRSYAYPNSRRSAPAKRSASPAASTATSAAASAFSAVQLPSSGSTYHLPILFAVLPPLGSLFIGSPDAWSDAITLLIVGFYLYHLIRVPWELYAAARARVGRHADANTSELKPSQRLAIQGLRLQERAALALVLAAPALGGLALWLLQQALVSGGGKYLTPGNILLYVLAASVRPISHLLDLINARSVTLHAEATYADEDISRLLEQVRGLECEVRDLRMAVVWRSDLEESKEELDSAVESVARAVRSMARREDAARKGSDARLDRLELKAQELEEWSELQRLEAARQSVLVRCVTEPGNVLKDMIGVGSNTPNGAASGRRGLIKHEEDRKA